MTTRVLILVRHGEYHQLPNTPSAHQPFPLTAEGRDQAIACAELVSSMLADQGWRLHPTIWSADLLRAYETALLLNDGLQGLGLACDRVAETAALRERSVGIGANLPLDLLEQLAARDSRGKPLPDDWKSNSYFRLPLPDAESLMEAGERVAACLTLISDDLEDGEAALVVGHGASMRHAAHHLGVLAFEEIAKLSMHHATPVALARADDGAWSHVAGAWKARGQGEALD